MLYSGWDTRREEVYKHDRRRERTQTGARCDPARSHPEADHRPGQAQAHPAQAGAEGQVAEMADQGVGGIVGDEHGPVGDHLHIASRTDLRRRWKGC